MFKDSNIKTGFTQLENHTLSRIKNTRKSLTGFTLLEALFAIFVIAVGLTGGISAILQLLNLSLFSSSKLTAAYLAQEGIEIVRNIRDTNWLEAGTNPSNPWDEGLNIGSNCLGGCIVDYNHSYDSGDLLDPDLPAFTGQFLRADSSGFYSYNGPIETQTKFQRKITITPAADFLNVKVDIFWSEKGKPYNFSAQENLYNWR